MPLAEVAVGGDIEGLVRVLRIVEVVGDGKLVRAVKIEINLAQKRVIFDRVFYRQSFVLASGGADEVDQRQPLTVGIAVDQRFIRSDCWRRQQDRSGPIGSLRLARVKSLANAFKRKERRNALSLADRPANGAAKLFATKILERLAVRGVRSQRFETLKVEQTAVHVVGSGFGDHIDDAAGGAAKFGARSGGHHLKFLYRFQRDVDRRALAAQLLAKEAIVVIAAVKTDVIENAALTGEGDLVAIGSLHDADSRRQRQQIFKLAAQNRSRVHRCLVERGARFCLDRVDGGSCSDRNCFLHRRNLHRERKIQGLTDSQICFLDHQRCETLL